MSGRLMVAQVYRADHCHGRTETGGFGPTGTALGDALAFGIYFIACHTQVV